MTLRSGDVFANRFEIDRVAGTGGMGTVYRVRDQLTADWVALKLLHDQGPGGGDTERFAREAQLLSELRHPGIVAHVAHGQTPQGQRFLAMQWFDGQDLGQRLEMGPLSLSDTLTLTARVAEALAFAHSRGVVHRDLKPTNLFLPGGDIAQVKLLDFGIARRFASSRAKTRTGMVIGTPEYMAPEQARGVRQLTPAADLFSLGCVLYECLTGDPPFVADHIATVLGRILFEEPVRVVQRRPGIPESISTLLSQMLEKDPARRLSDAMLVARAVAQLHDLPNLLLLPTLPSPQKSTPAPEVSEQVLLSLVLAISPQDFEGRNSTVLPSDVVAESERHGPLLIELRELGAQAELPPGGALVVTVPQMPSAQDQAAQAARLAALIKARWPEVQVAVVTGRGFRSHGGLTGEVLDRAWRLLRRPPTPSTSPAVALTQIRVDPVSAGLLEPRFTLAPLPMEEGFALGGERLDADAGRLLLGKPTPCLGRDRELTMLEAVYDECREEHVARAVLVLGPPGMGKSRLRREFVRRLEGRGAQGIVMIGRGDPLKVKSTYGILGEALRQRLDLREGQDLVEQRARLRQRVSAALPENNVQRVTMFLGEICGVPFPEEESQQLRAARQDPRIMSDQVEQAWLDGLQLLRTEEPLVLILEDLHWSDALTVKLVGAALRRLRNQPCMVLALARPEVYELYPNLRSGMVQPLQLNPLPRKAGERLVRQILGPDALPAQVTQLVEQSAGNPLFLEELIRSAIERKTGEHSETVMAMIQARIGRLQSGARRALRAASIFGETFWESGVRYLLTATHGDESVSNFLEDLVREEIVEKVPDRCLANQSQYHFRHALVQDAALWAGERRGEGRLARPSCSVPGSVRRTGSHHFGRSLPTGKGAFSGGQVVCESCRAGVRCGQHGRYPCLHRARPCLRSHRGGPG
jgi:serine/threonine protein kinase